MDIVGIYLKSILAQNKQPIFIKISQNRQLGQSSLVYKILKSLYSLKQVGRLWNKTIIQFFQKIGFDTINGDLCILILVHNGDFIVVGVYVNDLLLGSKSHIASKYLKDLLIKEFQMKDLGKAKTIIG